MNRLMTCAIAALACLGIAATARAHYLWIAVDYEPAARAGTNIYFEETATPGDGSYLDHFLGNSDVWIRTVEQPTPEPIRAEEIKQGEHRWMSTALPLAEEYSVDAYGKFGVYEYGQTKVLLHYYARNLAVVSHDAMHELGRAEQLELDLVPHDMGNRIEFTLLWKGKPVSNRMVFVRGLKGFRQNIKTDASGKIELERPATGGVTLRSSVEFPTPGEENGEAYELVRHNITLVMPAAADSPDESDSEEISLVSPEDDWSQASFWQTAKGNPVGEAWEFADGEVRLVKPRTGDGNILSPPLPPHFELSWEWKISPKTNTGLKYRVRKFANRYLGVEYQIIDETIPLKNPSKGSTASIYDLQAPTLDKPLKPAGQWNHARVVARGTQLQHFLNGKLVAETATVGTAWDAIYARSKFFHESGFAQPREGDRVMLTDHGGKAVYKNFQFTPLPAPNEAPALASSDGPFLANGIRNSWAEQNSIVLWTRTTKDREAKMDGVPFVKLSNSEARKLAKGTDAEQLLGAQLPAGATLDQMLGACPGLAGEVRLTYFPKWKRSGAKTTAWKTTTAAEDFTAQWHLDELEPGTEYAAIVETRPLGSDQAAEPALSAVLRGRFETAPEASSDEDVRFCMTTCHDFIRRDDGDLGHQIYPAFEKLAPDFVVHAGDIEYYDKPDPWAMTKELMRFKWQRIFALPSNRRFYANHTTYFIKDDHDTLKNDCWPGARYGSVSFEEGVKLFNEEQFPSHEPRYQTVSWGKHAQIWILEGRDYRSPNTMPDGPEKTILGKTQKEWLLRTLKESDATFKLLFSPTPIVGPDRENKSDNHANENFVYEGNQLRQAFQDIEGLIIFCGDRHWQYASLDDSSGLWEFGCGPGSADHELGWKPGDKRPEHQFLRVAGGFLSGQVKAQGKDGKPELTLRHHEVNGKQVSEFHFPVKD